MGTLTRGPEELARQEVAEGLLARRYRCHHDLLATPKRVNLGLPFDSVSRSLKICRSDCRGIS